MIEPISEAFTTSSMPARRATRAMISSAALPSVALRKPPMPSPTRAASFSVETPSRPASGMIATQASPKTSSGESGREWCIQRGQRHGEQQPGQRRLGQHVSHHSHGHPS